jgi:putative RNA 2'-phosphotransferase
MVPTDVQLSKKLSYWLRHKPGAGGVSLDGSGWADVRAVLMAFEHSGLACDLDRLRQVVASNDKQRFELSEDRARIRARQGHSVPIAHEWPRVSPPDLLFHGTTTPFLPAIQAQGLKRMRRHHVHLSGDLHTARLVGARRGDPVVLSVGAAAMSARGLPFYLTANGVWLTDHVPPEYLALRADVGRNESIPSQGHLDRGLTSSSPVIPSSFIRKASNMNDYLVDPVHETGERS